MKHRLLVMNGQRLLQAETEGQWETVKVSKAEGIKPGIYPLHFASKADRSIAFDGVILWTDKDQVFQLVGKAVIRHDRNEFESAPEAGSRVRIAYGDDKAIVAGAHIKTSRGRSR